MQEDERDVLAIRIFDEIDETVGTWLHPDVDTQDSPGWIISQPIRLILLPGPLDLFWAQTAYPVHYLSDVISCS
jgi:hypothetical protein